MNTGQEQKEFAISKGQVPAAGTSMADAGPKLKKKQTTNGGANAAYVTFTFCSFSRVLFLNAPELLLFFRPLFSNITVLCLKNWDFFLKEKKYTHTPLKG